MSVWWSSPSNSSFWGSFLPLQEMQNWRLQTNLGLGEWPCQTAGSASRRLLSSAAQLPKPCEAWHARKGSPVGTAGCPHHLQIRIPAPPLCRFPHFSAEKAHGSTKTKSRNQETYVQSGLCLSMKAASLLPPPIHTWREVPSSSDLRFKVCFQSFDIMCVTPGTEKVSHQCLQEGKEPLSGPSAGSCRGWSQHGGEGKTKSLHTFQYVLPPLRPSNSGRKINGSKVCCLLARWPWASFLIIRCR